MLGGRCSTYSCPGSGPIHVCSLTSVLRSSSVVPTRLPGNLITLKTVDSGPILLLCLLLVQMKPLGHLDVCSEEIPIILANHRKALLDLYVPTKPIYLECTSSYFHPWNLDNVDCPGAISIFWSYGSSMPYAMRFKAIWGQIFGYSTGSTAPYNKHTMMDDKTVPGFTWNVILPGLCRGFETNKPPEVDRVIRELFGRRQQLYTLYPGIRSNSSYLVCVSYFLTPWDVCIGLR